MREKLRTDKLQLRKWKQMDMKIKDEHRNLSN